MSDMKSSSKALQIAFTYYQTVAVVVDSGHTARSAVTHHIHREASIPGPLVDH